MQICATYQHVAPPLLLLYLIGGPFLFLLLLPYVVGPLRLWRSSTRQVEPAITEVELTQLPEEVAYSFQYAAASLVNLGFAAAAHLSLSTDGGKRKTIVSLWANHAARDTARVTSVQSASPQFEDLSRFGITFSTEFTDSSALLTTNEVSPSLFPPDPTWDSLPCFGLFDPAILYQVHRARVDRLAGARIATTEAIVDPHELFRKAHVALMARLTAAGYLVLDPVTQGYRRTIKGSVLMAWRLQFPLKQLRAWKMRRKSRRALRALGFPDLPAAIQLSSKNV